MITIRIQGPRGSGKTTTAIAIARLLRGHGQAVKYVGESDEQERTIESLLRDDDPPPFLLPGSFRVLDVDRPE